jgi:3-deoxy-D-manno-octulosonic-acid transferase
MRLRLTLLLYNLLLPFGLLILLPASLVKMRRRGGYGSAFWQRFGFFKATVKERLHAGRGKSWWIHAVSVGEVNVARKLIAEILRREPDRPLVLSVTTSTGHAVAVKGAPENLTVVYSPVDFGWVVRGVLRCIRPEKYILMEAELWPNLVRRAKKRGIPVALANARLSPRSERRYRKWRWLAGPLFSMLDLVLVQDESDAARWSGIGVPEERIRCTGSIKYDDAGGGTPDRTGEFRALLHPLWGEPLPPLLLAASTHNGEEKMLGAVFLELRRDFPNVRFLAVPRHFERRDEVSADLTSLGLRVALRSSLANAPDQADVLIVDSTGELRDWQAIATVVVVGKSFLTTGGQNPAEAIAAGVPVITGPHMENFQPLMELLRGAGGITEAASAEALLPALRQAFADLEAARAIAARGRQALELHRGAAARTAEAIAGLPKNC